MVGTRSSSETKRRLIKTLTETFQLEDENPILKAFDEEGIHSFMDIFTLQDSSIDDLKYTIEDPNTQQQSRVLLSKGHQGWIKSFIDFIRSLNIGTEESIEKVNIEDFNRYRIQHYNPPSRSLMNPGSNSHHDKEVENFKKSIKRDKSHYIVLRHDWQWDTWRRSTISTAKTHGCEEIFDPDYSPKTKSEKDLFAEKQKFIYDVFQNKVQTDMGKHLVRKYEGTDDAQSVYRKLSEHANQSTHASLEASDLISYITSTKLHKISWKGTYHSFILHWCDKVRLYEELIPVSDHFSDNLKKILLQNTVAGVKPLNSVKSQLEHDVARGKKDLSYQSYLSLLLSTATTIDVERGFSRDRAARSLQTQNRLNINMLLQDYLTNQDYETHNNDGYQSFMSNSSYNFNQQSNQEEIHNIDSMLVQEEFLNINQINSKHHPPFERGPKMAKDKWLSLSNQEQKSWDTFSNQSKAIILGITPPKIKPRFEGNLHDISVADYIAMMHNHNISDKEENNKEDTIPNQENQSPPENILSFLTNQQHPGDIRSVLSSPRQHENNNDSKHTSKRKINNIITHYTISNITTNNVDSLIDRGANGGLAGSDVRIINKHDPPRLIDISGINNHEVKDLEIVTAGGVVPSQRGEVIAILHQYAYLGKGNTIHSSIQIEAYNNKVDDRSIHHKGSQTITTNDGYIHPLKVNNGLPYIPIRPFTDEEWTTLPHVIWTSDTIWNPKSIDFDLLNDKKWIDETPFERNKDHQRKFDEYGGFNTEDFEDEFIVNHNQIDIMINQHFIHETHRSYNRAISTHKPPNYGIIKPFLLYTNDEVIRHTLNSTTQYGRTTSNSLQLKQTFRTPFPACNVTRRNEPVATDTVYSTTPAIDDGSTMAQIYVGRKSLVIDVYPIKTQREFIKTLEDNIRNRGAMDMLISDRAQVEINKHCHDILRAYCIKDWQSEPHYQHQNFAERKYAQIKPLVNRVLNTSGAPPSTWLLALQHVTRTLNHIANKSINWKTPLEELSGIKPDITSILLYTFWEKIYYRHTSPRFPHDSSEKMGRFVGVATNIGHALTFKVLSEESKVIFRSRIRSAERTDVKNKLLESSSDKEVVKSKYNRETLPTFDPNDLIGRTFLQDPDKDGKRLRATIIEKIQDDDEKRMNDPRFVKFRCRVNDDELGDIVTYADIMNHIERDDELNTDHNDEWKFKNIIGHEGPLSKNDKNYKGSRFNVLVQWETGSPTYEPLDLIGKDDPVTCAIYAKRCALLDTPGWKRFRRIIERENTFDRIINQAKLSKNEMNIGNIQYGIRIPRNHKEAMDLDRKNGNQKWLKAEQLELKQIFDYDTFIDKGKDYRMPMDYTKINVHFVYAVKHDGRHKARLVAGGHMTKIPDESIYSGVVSLKGIRVVIFLGKLNNLKIFSTDIGNAYLEAITKEKVYIIAGHEFGPMEGHTLVMNKALYGLRTSGLRWHERLADSLRELNFLPTKAEDDIWMRRNGENYEYIASYVDDLCIVAKDPTSIIDQLQDIQNYKLKGTGPINHHLGCDYFTDENGNLSYAPKTYIKKLITDFITMFGHKPKFYSSPLESNDHPEFDTSEQLDPNDTKKYQSMIGSLQWAVSLGRLDINTAVMTMSSFRAYPRRGHLKRLQRIYGYLAKFSQSAITIRTEEPDYSNIIVNKYEWENTIYGEVKELQPNDMPPSLGKPVTLTTYVDANLYHDMLTGRSVSGILHLVNKTPFDWYSKKQSTVETATYGSEFTAARIAVDHIVNHRNMFRYLGVKVAHTTYLFGDNESVINSSTIPYSKLHKRHTALSFHRVREAIASKIIAFIHIPGKFNPADILSKHWGYQQVKNSLRALLFYHGDTNDLFE